MSYFNTLFKSSKKELINKVFNEKISSIGSYFSDRNMYLKNSISSSCGKVLPYIGWYWRDIDFYDLNIQIGDCGEFIGVMENNKWDYPERRMTKEEGITFRQYIDKIISTFEVDGAGVVEYEETLTLLEECWNWFQTLKI